MRYHGTLVRTLRTLRYHSNAANLQGICDQCVRVRGRLPAASRVRDADRGSCDSTSVAPQHHELLQPETKIDLQFPAAERIMYGFAGHSA